MTERFYNVVVEETLAELIIEVNRQIGAGWRCQGGVCVVKKYYEDGGTPAYHSWFYQAMVR